MLRFFQSGIVVVRAFKYNTSASDIWRTVVEISRSLTFCLRAADDLVEPDELRAPGVVCEGLALMADGCGGTAVSTVGDLLCVERWELETPCMTPLIRLPGFGDGSRRWERQDEDSEA